ncbi:putative auxin efflux carrier component 8 [Acorus calamus]|uniref:Auxin efflux carrier component 8 n=1 Tax=Acorus calamus TaxID=4465 RepID=A0AAV9EZF1_ACOCL|nr:putative auxin efflux carrier component 8 [Acorus calamus]
MISWGDIYKVVKAMVPLYFALGLGYGSVRWWRVITPEQCEAINRLVSFFTLPLFTFEFTLHTDPFSMNYPFIAADAISKVVIVAALAAWARLSSKGSYTWSITSFSLSTLTNSLVVGVPLLKAMYGPEAQELVVQSSVVQAIVWLTVLLFVLELRKARYRWHFEMPDIIEGSITIMSRAGTGMAMFSMGLFMALQEKVVACGPSLTVFGMALRFVAGPAAMAIGSIAVGLHGDVLRIAIIQVHI